MHRLEQIDPHHLGNSPRVVAVALVDLLRRQKRLYMPGLNADQGIDEIRCFAAPNFCDERQRAARERPAGSKHWLFLAKRTLAKTWAKT